ncbi:MAG TPA: Ppx/GppA phosphatase family protein, partial [Myxococcota bacterium]|nr:Ppx/GppA phosphatase family protein [Myxococcota bacterium]
IDVGTNSIHMLVADVRPDGSTRHVESARAQVMLGSGGLGAHRIQPDAFERGVEAMRSLRAAAQSLDVEDFHAAATSAVREASNGPAFVRAVRDATDIHVRVISGADEARLIYLGARSALDFSRGPVALFDVGGGSTEFILANAAEPIELLSLHLGHIRLADAFQRSDPLSADDRQAIKRAVRKELKHATERITPGAFAQLVGTSGTSRCLARMCHAARTGQVPDHDEGLVMTRKELERLLARLMELPRSRYDELPGMDPRRRDTLAPGAALVREIMKGLRADRMTTSERGLRDGLIVDWILHHRPEIAVERTSHNPRERSVLAAMERFGVEPAHARQVARLATSIFDRTARVHNLPSADRELLHDGALLHDIGHHIAGHGHPQHGQYLLKHIRMYGFDAAEVTVLASLARYHSRTRPKRRHHDFAALSKDDQRRVSVLAGILQVADALDRSHNQPVDELTVDTAGGSVKIRASCRGDGDLERWEVAQRLRLLSDALGVAVEVDIVGEEPEP